MTKKELRSKYKNLRSQLSAEEIENLSLELANQALKTPIWDKTNYHLFLSIEEKKEINTEYIMHILAGKDKNIFLPKTNFTSNTMSHILLTDNTLIEKNSYNIPEPVDGISVDESQIEVVFIPLLAFDNKGNRVGYGKGFYDNFLSLCKPEVIKIGLSFFDSEELIDDAFEGDIPLDYCITPNKIYAF